MRDDDEERKKKLVHPSVCVLFLSVRIINKFKLKLDAETT